ncbi:MAG: dihydroxyacetone kinase subunit L [Caldilineaceae bacterium]
MAISNDQVRAALTRAAAALERESGRLNDLDQAMGDGDIGITLEKIGVALQEYAATTPVDDVGKWLGKAGMAANKAGSSSFGTLLATSLMRAGKSLSGKSEVAIDDLAPMLLAAAEGMQERGKASLGDKTVLDAIFPAAEAFAAAMQSSADLADAGRAALAAAEAGRDAVTPLRSRIGRASWVGERTEGLVDPGCEAFVVILRALVEK